MSKTEIKHCRCVHDFQDSAYGPGQRVHNARRIKDGKVSGWRCTVCARETETAAAITAPAAAPRSGRRR